MQLNKALRGHHDLRQSFSQSGILVQAAIAGQGIALAPYVIACEDLRLGNLKQIAGRPLLSSCHYYAICGSRIGRSRHVNALCSWLEDEFRTMRSLRHVPS